VQTLIRSNNQSVEAVSSVYKAMVQCIKDNHCEGRGFLYCRIGDDSLWFVSLNEFEKDDGATLIDIDPDQYIELLELVRSGYSFEEEFVYVVRQETALNTLFSVNIGSLHDEGWTGFRTEAEIKEREAEYQKAIARARVEQMRRDRGKGKKKGKR